MIKKKGVRSFILHNGDHPLCKMKDLTPYLFALMLLAIHPAAAGAEWYVAGAPIPLRAEPDPSNRQILQLLSAGDPVTLSNKSRDGFSLVTTPSGSKGWIPSRYLTNKPLQPSTSAPFGGKARLQIELENSRLKSRISSIQQEKQILESETQKLRTQFRKANQELSAIRSASGNVLELENQNYLLKDQVRVQKRELEVLQQENEALQDRKDRDWFLVGALVAFLALVTGFFLSRVRSNNIRNRTRI